LNNILALAKALFFVNEKAITGTCPNGNAGYGSIASPGAGFLVSHLENDDATAPSACDPLTIRDRWGPSGQQTGRRPRQASK
jgi:hypothetical protein